MLRRDFLKSVPPALLLPQLRSAPRLQITAERCLVRQSVKKPFIPMPEG